MSPEVLAPGTPAGSYQLELPAGARGLALLARAECRDGPRERELAESLQRRGLGTLTVDLLTEAERSRRANVYNMPLLAHRLFQAMDWLRRRADLRNMALGLFGAGTAASAAIVCAAERPQAVRAVVARAGRPELALESLDRVRAPTLLIVGDADCDVLQLNYDAYRQLRCIKRLEVIPQAGCGFEEPASMKAAAGLLGDWFAHHLAGPPAGSGLSAASFRNVPEAAWTEA